MAVTIAQFLEIADRLSKQWEILSDAVTAANANGGTGKKHVGYVVDGNDGDFVNRLLRHALRIDEDRMITSYLLSKFQWYKLMILGLKSWIEDDLGSDIDTYLSDNSAKVHTYFDTLWHAIIGTHIDPGNIDPAREIAL